MATLPHHSWEIRTAPIALLARWLTIDLSYRPTEHWAFGPSLISYNARRPGGFLGPNYRGLALGFNLNYYFSSAHTSSGYISSHAYHENYESYPHAQPGYLKRSGYKTNMALGYQIKSSEISMLTGLGFEYLNYQQDEIDDSVSPTTSVSSPASRWLPFIEFKLGYSF